MNTAGKIALAIIGTGAVYGIAYARKQATLIENSCYKPMIPRKVSFKKDHAEIDMDIQVRNLADFDITIVKQNLDVFLNDKFIANITGKEKVTLKAHTAVLLPLDIKFAPEKSFDAKELWNIVMKAKENKFTVKGKITAKTSFIFLPKIPIEFSYTIAELMAPSTTDYCK